jgi:hypothetical protein
VLHAALAVSALPIRFQAERIADVGVRVAPAVYAKPELLRSLQALMNHSRIDTTQIYLRALNKTKVMEAVRTSPEAPCFRP